MQAGRKVILTELVEGIQAGYFFGPGSPHNAGKDLAALTARAPAVTEAAVVSEAFTIAARIHAAYWGSDALQRDPRFTCLRCREWGSGGGRDSWESSLSFSQSLWVDAKLVRACHLQWDPTARAAHSPDFHWSETSFS